MNKILIGAGVLLGLGALAAVANAAEDKPAGGDGPAKPGDKPAGGGGEPAKPTKDPTMDPWMPLPYDSYQYPLGPGESYGKYTIDLTALGNGVRWRLWETHLEPETEAQRDAFKLGAGLGTTEEEARIAAEAFAESFMNPKAHPMPPKPTLDASLGPAPTVRHGLRFDDGRIGVDDLVTWIAWASPYLQTRVKDTNRVELVRGLLQETFPEFGFVPGHFPLEGLKVGDRKLLELLGWVDAKYFEPARQGLGWAATSLDEPGRFEKAAAELVGGQAPSSKARRWAFKGYEVEVDHVPGQWTWAAWRRGKGENDPPPDLQGATVSQRRVVREAKAKIEQAS